MNYLGQLRHPNLVKLIGYCCEDDHRLLVYEYMESGSLEKHLFPSEYLISMRVHVGEGETNSTCIKVNETNTSGFTSYMSQMDL